MGRCPIKLDTCGAPLTLDVCGACLDSDMLCLAEPHSHAHARYSGVSPPTGAEIYELVDSSGDSTMSDIDITASTCDVQYCDEEQGNIHGESIVVEESDVREQKSIPTPASPAFRRRLLRSTNRFNIFGSTELKESLTLSAWNSDSIFNATSSSAVMAADGMGELIREVVVSGKYNSFDCL